CGAVDWICGSALRAMCSTPRSGRALPCLLLLLLLLPPSCLSSLAVHLYPISSVLNCLHVGRIPNMPVYKFNFHCLCSSACLVWTRRERERERETVVVIGRSVLCLKAILFPLSSRSFWIKLNR
ncbi:unnamed protein product, partial [Musa acuminata subsp. burmannicoides]